MLQYIFIHGIPADYPNNFLLYRCYMYRWNCLMLNSRYFFADFFSSILNHGIQTGLFMLLVCQDPHQFCLLDTYTLSQYKSKSPHKNRARHGWSRSNTVYVRQWAKYSKNYIFQYIQYECIPLHPLRPWQVFMRGINLQYFWYSIKFTNNSSQNWLFKTKKIDWCITNSI